MKTLRLKVRPEAYPWLCAAAIEVNQIWNWDAEYSQSRILNGLAAPTGYDLDRATVGSTRRFAKITSETINLVNHEYATKRRKAGKPRLRWRVSHGPRRSLGWVPFKGTKLTVKRGQLRYSSKTFRVFDRERLDGVKWKSGCFAQDAVGDWWLCLPVEVAVSQGVAPREAVGIDLGLKAIATTSDGDTLAAGRFYRDSEKRIGQALRRGHKRKAKRLYRKAARRRADALHKFSRKIVDSYQIIVVGDVSSTKLVKTRMAKSVLDSGWGMLKAQLLYKGQQAGRSVEVVSERYTSRACSGCGSLSGPAGLDMLAVRAWVCADCGESHDRDVNAARNILARAKALASVSGYESRNAA